MRWPRQRNARGWAAIDLVVVMLVAGLLLTMATPALQRAREKARAATCNDRLAAIALAIHNFHDAVMRLPPGTLSYVTPPKGLEEAMATPGLSQNDCQNTSALFLILPWFQASDAEEARGLHPNRFVDLFDSVMDDSPT